MSAPGFEYAQWSFPAEASAVRAARSRVRSVLRRWDQGANVDIAELLVSELVTNSLRYATGPIGVRVTRHADTAEGLLVEVSDPVEDPPRESRSTADSESGRGIGLVATAARRWGVHQPAEGRGKSVWFELAPRRGAER